MKRLRTREARMVSSLSLHTVAGGRLGDIDQCWPSRAVADNFAHRFRKPASQKQRAVSWCVAAPYPSKQQALPIRQALTINRSVMNGTAAHHCLTGQGAHHQQQNFGSKTCTWPTPAQAPCVLALPDQTLLACSVRLHRPVLEHPQGLEAAAQWMAPRRAGMRVSMHDAC